jgi:hypothetical protein
MILYYEIDQVQIPKVHNNISFIVLKGHWNLDWLIDYDQNVTLKVKSQYAKKIQILIPKKYYCALWEFALDLFHNKTEMDPGTFDIPDSGNPVVL